MEIKMLKKILIVSGLISALNLFAVIALAADDAAPQKSAQAEPRERIYGSQLMTRQERDEYRAKKHGAKSAEERDRIRKEHNDRMKARAKELKDKERSVK
jgi:multidrug resistance efflux pump